MPTSSTQVQLDPILFQVLAEESQKRQLSISELLHDFVRRYIEEASLSRKSKPMDHTALIGLGDSGVSDVSERHDHYLGEVIAHEHLH